MSLQAQKELELKLHQQLYNNIYLLTLVYAPSDTFKIVFKKDMFVKNNKAAFHHVIHYLLWVLDPDKLKEKVSSWPIFDVKMEAQFRNEILKYLNEISTTYEDSNIPQIMPSHLISPGGFKFVKFMFKVSELVLLEHLKKDEKIKGTLLLPIKPSKLVSCTKERIENIQIIIREINHRIEEKMKFYESTLSEARNEADQIMHHVKESESIIHDLREKCEIIQKEIKTELPSFNLEQGFCSELECIKDKLKCIQISYEQYKKCVNIAEYLNNEDNVLEYNQENFVVLSQMNQFLKKSDILVFTDLIDAFTNYINHLRLTFKPLYECQVKESTQNCSNLLEESNSVNTDLQELNSKIVRLLEQVNEIFPTEQLKINREPFRHLQFSNVTEEQGKIFLGDSILAVPLEVSLENKENI